MMPERFRSIASTGLIIGVTAASALVAAGFVGTLLIGWESSALGATGGENAATDFSALAAHLVSLRPIGLAQLGLVVLVATPVLRVAALIIEFALEGDRLYVGISTAVLVVMLLSLFVVR